MNIFQFWAEEAEREGKGRSGLDLMSEAQLEADRETAEDEQKLKDNPEACWDMILAVAERDLLEWQNNAADNGKVEQWSRFDFVKGVTVKEESAPYDAGPRPHFPTKLIDVQKVRFGGGLFSNASVEVTALVECDDGVKRVCRYQSYHDSGSMFSPPESDESLAWDDGTGSECL